MYRVVFDWIIVLSVASVFAMMLLSSPVPVEGMEAPSTQWELSGDKSTPTHVSKNSWRIRRRNSRKSIAAKHHAYRVHHDTPTDQSIHDTPTDPIPQIVHSHSGHRAHKTGTYITQKPQPLALPLAGPIQQSTSSETSELTPEFVIFQPVVQFRPNSLATLPCSVKNLGKRQVAWRSVTKDKFLTIGKVVWSSKDPRILVDYRQEEGGITTWNLLIKNVDSGDAGMYQCQITSSEMIVMNVELRVEEPTTTVQPKIRILKKIVTQRDFRNTRMDAADQQRHPQREEYITAGMPIRLRCNTSMDNLSPATKIQMTWYKEGYVIKSSKHTLVTWHRRESDRMYVSELYIDRSSRGDSGEYHCKLKGDTLETVMIYVLPNTTIGSDAQDSHSNYYSVGSLTTEDEAVALMGWPRSCFCACILSLCFSSTFSSFWNILVFAIDKHTKFLDPT